MVKFILVTHGNIGKEMIKYLKIIMKELPPIQSIPIFHKDSPEKIRTKIERGISKKPSPQGTLILTDLFGCTHYKQCASLLKTNNVEIVSGINFPMLMKLATIQNDLSLTKLTNYIKDYGKKNILATKEVAQGNKEE